VTGGGRAGGRLGLSALHRRGLRLAVARHRRLLAAGAAAAAVAAGVQSLSPSPPSTRRVWVAARDLPAGHRLGDGDLQLAALPTGSVPDGSTGTASGTGQVLAAPVRRGEPVTDVRLLGPGLLAGRPEGTVAVTVRVADPAATAAVRAGSRVDVLALPASGAEG
jgi:pilus assembly protein CpaB